MPFPAPDIAAALQFAVILRDRGRAAEAEGVAHRVIAVDPHNASAWCLLAELCVRQGRDQAALLAARAAIALDPAEERARHLASALLGRGDARGPAVAAVSELRIDAVSGSFQPQPNAEPAPAAGDDGEPFAGQHQPLDVLEFVTRATDAITGNRRHRDATRHRRRGRRHHHPL